LIAKLDSGLSRPEEQIVSYLVDAWNMFVLIEPNKDDLDDFRAAINVTMRIIQSRALSRMYPDFWNK